jgi:uncharacterized protein (DUF2164 family)
MDFYNFEKYNDIFCFKKLSNDYQPLLRIYKDNYQTSLNTFLKEYEENTELRFIESQLYFCNKEIGIQKSIITNLEKLDHETFYYVRNRINEKHFVYVKTQRCPFENKPQTNQTTPENSNNDDSKELKAPIVIHYTNDDDDDDDDEVLDMYATAKNFIKFISNRITSLYLINEFLEQSKQELEKELKTIPPQVSAIETKQKPDKSLMLGGEKLNISERYKILNKVLDFDKKVHPLNIGELEKYQLLSYILGIDKDNARKLMCGSYDSKDRDLTSYFNDLDLNK